MTHTPFRTILASSIALALFAPAASATTYTWDATGDALGLIAGGGNWNSSGGTNWLNAGTYGAWGNTSADEAIFGGGDWPAFEPIVVNVGAVTANRITFQDGGMSDYFLDGGTITLAGTTPTLAVAPGVNGRIASTIAGSAGLRVAMGAIANLTLSGNNTYTGATTVNGGTLTIEPTVNVGNNGTLTQSSSSYAVGSGTTLRFDGSAVQGGTQFAVWDINPVNVALNGTLELFTDATIHNNPDTNALLFNWTNADQFTGGGFIRKLGAGAAAINGTNALTNFTGNFFVSEGTLSLQGATTTANSTFRMIVDGGSLDIRSGNHTVGGLSGSGAIIKSFSSASTLSVGSNNQNADFFGNITGAGNPTALALRKIGSGTQNLYGMNTYSGATTLEAGVLALNFGDAGVTSNMLSPASPLVLGGGALSLTGGGPATQTFNTASTAANTGSRIFVGADKTLTLSAFTPGANAALNFDVSAGGANGATVGTAIVVLTGTLNANITVSDTGFGRAGLNGSNQVVRLTTDPLLPASGATSANHYRIDNNAGGPAASGSASLALTASQSAGSITVDTTTGAGTLTLGSGVALSSNIFNFGGGGTNPYQITGGTGLTSVASGNTIAFNNYNGGTVTIGSPIVANGTNAMVFNGPGTTALTATNTFTGALLVSGGSVEIAGSGRLGSGSYAAGITIGNGSTFKYKSSEAQTLTGAIDGSGTFAHEGTGTVTLTTAAGGSAATTVGVSGGGVNSLLEMNSGATLANTAAVTIHKDARLLLLGTDPSGNLNGNQLQSAASNPSLVINGTLEAAGNQAHTLYATNITMNDGTLTSSGSNPETNVGGAQFGAYFVSGSRTITLNGAANAISGTRGLGINTGAVLTLHTPQATDAAAVSVTLGIGTAGSAGGLAKSGAGTVTLSASNAYEGATTVNGGTLEIGGAGQLGGGTYANDIAIASGATFKYNSSAAQTLSGAIDGSGTFAHEGGSTVTVTSAAGGAGATTVGVGGGGVNSLLEVNSGARLANTAAVTIHKDARLLLLGTDPSGNSNGNQLQLAASNPSLVINGTLEAAGNQAHTLYATNITMNNGTLTSSGSNPGTNFGGAQFGAFFVSGSRTITLNGATNAISGTRGLGVNTGAVLTLHTPQATDEAAVSVTVGIGTAGSAGGLAKSGAGTVTLSASNAYTGATTVNGGTFEIGGAGQLGGGTYAGDIAIGSGATFKYNSSAAQSLTGIISGAGALVKDGSATLTLTGTNTYSGATTISGGALSIAATPHLPSASAVTLSGGGTLRTTANLTLANAVTIASGQTGVIQATGTNTTTLVGNHSGVAGTLTLDLVGVTSNYGGMLIGAGATGPAAGSVINILGATGANNVQVAANATETIDYFANSKVSVTATGSGNTYLAFGNGFSTHVRFGALDGGNATTLVGFDNKTGTAVTIEGIANGNFAGRIFDGFTPGSLELIKNGTATQTLSGTNTYTGTTTVNAGTLVVTGSISGTSTTVSSTATLSGTGTVGGSTTVNGTLEGGIGAAGGTLTFTSAVSLSGSSVIKLALDGALNHSTLAFNGAEIFDATQDFNFLNLGAVTGTYTSILTGITTNPGSLAGWEILNPGFVGTFAYNSGNQAIDLNLIAIPEPNAVFSLLGGLGVLLGLRHRRRS